MNFSARNLRAVAFRLSKIEREVVLTPNHQQARLLFAHPCLPLWIRVYISSVIVEQIAFAPELAGSERQIHRSRDQDHSVPRSDRSPHGVSALSAATDGL